MIPEPDDALLPVSCDEGIARHAELLRAAAPDRLPEFVKQMTWDFGLNLLAYSEWIDPLRFDPAQALEGFALWQRYLETIAGLARDAQAGGTADVESFRGSRRTARRMGRAWRAWHRADRPAAQ